MDWIASALTFVAVALSTRRSIWCWPLFIGSNILWLTHWLPKAQWAACAMNLAFFVMNIYGWYQWRKKNAPAPEAQAKEHPNTNAYLTDWQFQARCWCWRCDQHRIRQARLPLRDHQL